MRQPNIRIIHVLRCVMYCVVATLCGLCAPTAVAQSEAEVKAWFEKKMAQGQQLPVIGNNEMALTVTRYCPLSRARAEALRPQVRSVHDHPSGPLLGWFETEQREGPETLTIRYWCPRPDRARMSETGGRKYVNPYIVSTSPTADVVVGSNGRDPAIDTGLNQRDAWVLETSDLRVDDSDVVVGDRRGNHQPDSPPGVVEILFAHTRGRVAELLQMGMGIRLTETHTISKIEQVQPDVYSVVLDFGTGASLFQIMYRVRFLRELASFVVERREVTRAPFDLTDYPGRVATFSEFWEDDVLHRVCPRRVEISGNSSYPREVIVFAGYTLLSSTPDDSLFNTPTVGNRADPVRGELSIRNVHDGRTNSIQSYGPDGAIIDVAKEIQRLKKNPYRMLGWVLGAIGLSFIGLLVHRKGAMSQP